MIKGYPELIYNGDDNAAGKIVYGLYIPFIHEQEVVTKEGKKITFKKYLSEDWAMTQRWKAIGGKVFADTSIVLNHVGKFTYSLWNVELVKRPVIAPPPAGFDLSNSKTKKVINP